MNSFNPKSSAKSPREIQCAKCFTLIELLVVVAIIAVLVSLLLPALAETRRSARKVICATRVRTLVYAYLEYAKDNNGKFPRIVWANYPTSIICGPQGLRSSVGILWEKGYLPVAWHFPVDLKYQNRDAQHFVCPESFILFTTDQMNSSVVGMSFMPYAGSYDDPWRYAKSPLRDSDPPCRPMIGDYSSGSVASMSNHMTKGKVAGANWSFLDGHVSWVEGGRLNDIVVSFDTYLLPKSPE